MTVPNPLEQGQDPQNVLEEHRNKLPDERDLTNVEMADAAAKLDGVQEKKHESSMESYRSIMERWMEMKKKMEEIMIGLDEGKCHPRVSYRVEGWPQKFEYS